MEKPENFQQQSSPQFFLCLMENSHFLGKLTDFTTHAQVRGPCGDSMEFYLIIENNIIKEVKCLTDGCDPTRACAVLAASLVRGQPIGEALKISAGDILEKLNDLPDHHRHCSILAVSTLYRAIAGYLLRN